MSLVQVTTCANRFVFCCSLLKKVWLLGLRQKVHKGPGGGRLSVSSMQWCGREASGRFTFDLSFLLMLPLRHCGVHWPRERPTCGRTEEVAVGGTSDACISFLYFREFFNRFSVMRFFSFCTSVRFFHWWRRRKKREWNLGIAVLTWDGLFTLFFFAGIGQNCSTKFSLRHLPSPCSLIWLIRVPDRCPLSLVRFKRPWSSVLERKVLPRVRRSHRESRKLKRWTRARAQLTRRRTRSRTPWWVFLVTSATLAQWTRTPCSSRASETKVRTYRKMFICTFEFCLAFI